MASKEFTAFQEKMASNPVPPPPKDIQELRARIDGAMGQLPLAGGTTAVAVSANGVDAFLEIRDGGDDDPLVIYFHGGGYRIASALAYRAYCSHFAARAGARVLNVHYRLAPEDPFPAAVDDALSAYQWALDNGTPASRIVLAGDSAGGGLTAAALVAIRDRGLAAPAGGICLSPWVDLTNTSATYTSRATADKMFSLASATEAAGLYLQGQDPKAPLASPVFADLSGLPPLLILVGDAEVLLDDSRTLAERASAAGVPTELFVYAEMPHVWMLNYPAYPEAAQAFDQMASFVARVTRL
ncbi:MAG: alpha/beta hydrolase [Actinobacteria bacterium]|nr:MAG: alpha/beta hydrolase [Actinomycetota bacterium]